MLKLKTVLSIKGTTSENEDVFGIKDNYFWVIDGATDLFDCKDSLGVTVAQCMGMISDELYNVCGTTNSLRGDLKLAVVNVSKCLLEGKELTREDYAKLPTFSLVYGVLKGDLVSYVVLGDCYLMSGSQVVTDGRISEFSKNNRKKIEEYLANVSEEYLPKVRKGVFRETRLKANSVGGYPIGSLDVNSIDNAISGSLDVSSGFVVMSDGFYKFYKTVNNVSDALSVIYDVEVDEVYGKRDDATVIEVL